ncbi:MAG: NADH dehydrogenase FAD-containing subunit [Deltaproteobacteria bacterium]|nr:NADH dehydrogenase FAD-containing subunit [Deltaproteobacteria bacterium]
MIQAGDSLALWLQLLFPAACGVAVFAIPRRRLGTALLAVSSALHLCITAFFWFVPRRELALEGWLALDEIGRLFLGIVSVLFAAAAAYVVGYLSHHRLLALQNAQGDKAAAASAAERSERIFISSLLFFLSTMTLVTFCQHFELLWVAIEATTLASAPLVYFHRGPHALEATWKYLVICSFGIALALLGNFLLSIAAPAHAGGALTVSSLLSRAALLDRAWLKAAFIFLFVGYGTKMGLAPLHTWLPDAHSEAPSAVSSLLSGALLSCAFVGILRAFHVCVAAGLGSFAQGILVTFGLISMGFAAVFIIRQQDYKRMLAYSSVEHMGVLSLSVGLGGAAVFAGMLHAIGHALIKAMLFLVAGNILIAYHTKSAKAVRGVLRALPASGVLWFLGLFAITGFPPFGLFTSEFLILRFALERGRYGVAIPYLLFLSLIFIGMASVSLPMLLGEPQGAAKTHVPREWRWSILPPVALAFLALALGPHIPPFLKARIDAIAVELNTGVPGGAK